MPHFIITRTKLWRVLDRRETFFWFRVSVSIEKVQVTFKFFSLHISINQRGMILNIIKVKSLNKYSATETTIGSFTGQYKIADINFEERK